MCMAWYGLSASSKCRFGGAEPVGVQTPSRLMPCRSTSGAMAWANDNRTLDYVTKDKLDRPLQVPCAYPHRGHGFAHECSGPDPDIQRFVLAHGKS